MSGCPIHPDSRSAATRRRRRRRRRPARLQRRHELRRLPAPGRRAQRPASAQPRPQRDAVHRAAPDQRAVDEADAARAACGRRGHRRRPHGAGLQDAGAGVEDHGAAGARLGRAGHDDAARVQRHPALPGQQQRLPELAVPLHRIQPGQQECRDAEAARAPARPAGARGGGVPRAFALRRGAAPAGAPRPAGAGQPHRARLDPALRGQRRRRGRLAAPSTARPRPTGTCTSWARNSPTWKTPSASGASAT